MKLKFLVGLALATFIFTSCDDTTGDIGSGTLIDGSDGLNIVTDTFEIKTRSIVADSVLARTYTGYIGKVRDPETGAYLSSDFMTQFYLPEGFEFPEKDSIKSLVNGQIVADSCDIRLYYKEYYGDILAVGDYRYCGADIGFGRVDIHGRISKDNGQTWGTEFKIARWRRADCLQR